MLQSHNDKRWLFPILLITAATLSIYAAFLISDFYHGQTTDTYQITIDRQSETPDLVEESQAEEEPTPIAGNFTASKNGEKYHRTDCRHAAGIKEVNRISFATVDDAVAAGYEPCGVCHPDK
ncbi:MAG: Ada metal-binding domain-containing protein [Eubacteriales bacterium]|nr:Ada metal-binding domain-containing protein [Eubacteriales bacterium]